MARYIDANLLLQQIVHKNSTVEQGIKYFNSVYNIIQEQPTADVEEVKHGDWINGRRNYWKNNVYEEMCSVCGRYSQEYRRGYCPHCGAKMDGGKANDL